METTHVLYRGKKPQLLLRMKYLSQEYLVRDGAVVEMTAEDAKVLIKKNPVPFSVVAPGNPEYKIPVKKKYVSQMNRTELVEHVKEQFGVDVGDGKTKRQIKILIARLEKAKPEVAEPKVIEPEEANDGNDREPGPSDGQAVASGQR